MQHDPRAAGQRRQLLQLRGRLLQLVAFELRHPRLSRLQVLLQLHLGCAQLGLWPFARGLCLVARLLVRLRHDDLGRQLVELIGDVLEQLKPLSPFALEERAILDPLWVVARRADLQRHAPHRHEAAQLLLRVVLIEPLANFRPDRPRPLVARALLLPRHVDQAELLRRHAASLHVVRGELLGLAVAACGDDRDFLWFKFSSRRARRGKRAHAAAAANAAARRLDLVCRSRVAMLVPG